MLRLAILLRPLAGIAYLRGDLVYVAADTEIAGRVRVTHVRAPREKTDGSWAEPADFVFLPVGAHKDDVPVAVACHRIAATPMPPGDERAAAEAVLREALGPSYRGP